MQQARYPDRGYQIYRQHPTMISSRKKDRSVPKIEEPKPEPGSVLRRSSRVVKVKCDDDFLMGHDQLDQIIGRDASEDGYGANRPRRSYYHDDLSDFSDTHRHGRKKCRAGEGTRREAPGNSVEGLLRWRHDIANTPIPEPNKDNSQLVKVKNISKEQLDKHGQGIEALFVNIDWDRKNQRIEDFKNLRIQSLKLMSKGLVFIWMPKEYISEIIQIMEEKGFGYVENLQIAILDRQKALDHYRLKLGPFADSSSSSESKKKKSQKSDTQDAPEPPLATLVACLEGVDPNTLIYRSPSPYFNKSKRTLYIFRRSTEQKLQLRHQRTCDVVFEMPINPDGKCEPQLKNYLFMMIETMLPKCLEFSAGLKMMELWGETEMKRRGWVTVVEQ